MQSSEANGRPDARGQPSEQWIESTRPGLMLVTPDLGYNCRERCQNLRLTCYPDQLSRVTHAPLAVPISDAIRREPERTLGTGLTGSPVFEIR